MDVNQVIVLLLSSKFQNFDHFTSLQSCRRIFSLFMFLHTILFVPVVYCYRQEIFTCEQLGYSYNHSPYHSISNSQLKELKSAIPHHNQSWDFSKSVSLNLQFHNSPPLNALFRAIRLSFRHCKCRLVKKLSEYLLYNKDIEGLQAAVNTIMHLFMALKKISLQKMKEILEGSRLLIILKFCGYGLMPCNVYISNHFNWVMKIHEK